ERADAALARAVARALQTNSIIAGRVHQGSLMVRGHVKPTLDVVTDLMAAVFAYIDDGYGRRFANPFKDVFRELHRYLKPELDRLPYDDAGQRQGTRKAPHHERVRADATLQILGALGVGKEELSRWLAEEKVTNVERVS